LLIGVVYASKWHVPAVNFMTRRLALHTGNVDMNRLHISAK
jgi:hypothetical protein